MRRHPGTKAGAAMLAAVLVLASGCSMMSARNSPARKPSTAGSPTGLIPAKLQTAASLGTLMSWRDFQTLNPKDRTYRKVGRDSVSGADIYGPAPTTSGSPGTPGTTGTGGTAGTGGNATGGTGTTTGTGTTSTVGATPLPSAMYILVDASGHVIGVRGQLPPGVPIKPWYDKGTMGTGGTAPGATGTGTGTTGTGAKGTGTGGTSSTGVGTGGTAPGAGTTGTTPRTGMTTGATTSGPTMTAYFTKRRATRTGTAPGGTSTTGTNRGAGGTSTAPGGTTTTTVTAGTSDLRSFTDFKRVNPSWSTATRLTGFIPMMGTHWGHLGPGLVLMTDRANRATAFEVELPARKDGSDWKPYYDQLPGRPMFDPKTGSYMWSQHVYFIVPEVIR